MLLPKFNALKVFKDLRAKGANNITAIGGRDKEPAGHSPRHRGSLSARAIRNGERCSGRLSAISTYAARTNKNSGKSGGTIRCVLIYLC